MDLMVTLFHKNINQTTMLFDKKTKKAIKRIWVVVGALLILSMILLYAPIF
jgi:predicted nucleic acid-binding Zn ribbon protein